MKAAAIQEASTITAKGQTTVPKAVRQVLGVDYGGKIVFRVEGGRVTVAKAETEHHDPALGSFLKLVRNDLAHGRNVADLPPRLSRAMRKLAKEFRASPDETLEGEVAL